MANDPAAGDPFPRRSSGLIRVASPAEQGAVVAAYPPTGGEWEVAGRVRLPRHGGVEEHVTLRSLDGGPTVLRFDVSAFDDPRPSEEWAAGSIVDRLMQAALAQAREAGPLHPGALPRCPVPSAAYAGRVAVPLALLAVDDAGRRGLYGPDRLAVLSFPDGEPVGVGDAPGFDPERWPPPRLGDWPPPALRGVQRRRLEGIVARFGALWERLLRSFLAGSSDPYRRDEAAEALALLALLDPPAMPGVYRRLSPTFWAWLSGGEP